ncbi:coiled-coil domain-containing protein 183-like [Brachyistius frenatus]|uniref:coiled-coil domain-containing protein 183-like n=1 Tax=Brachyistius frenatus TaxID=100188 RepID=UPI0037E79801
MKTSEKQAEVRATSQDSDSYDDDLAALPLEKKLDIEKRRRQVQINAHNRMEGILAEKKARLKELQELRSVMEDLAADCEDSLQQQVRQLSNKRDKIRMKITEAQNIRNAYQRIVENLLLEVRGMEKVLDQKELAVVLGDGELEEAKKRLENATTSAGGAADKMVQMEHEVLEKKREMEDELYKLLAEKKELKKQMEKYISSPSEQRRLNEHETKASAAHSDPATEVMQRRERHSLASESDLMLIEEMEALREAVAFSEDQRATKEQLLEDKVGYEDEIEEQTRRLSELELRYTELKFSENPAALRFNKLKDETSAQLKEVKERLLRLQAEVKRSQDQLDTTEWGVNNLYFLLSGIPVEGLPDISASNSVDKLMDIRARLQKLREQKLTQAPDVGALDQNKVYDLLEEHNTEDPRNNRRPASPSDSPEPKEDDEEGEKEEGCSPTREEIKRNSVKLIESQQRKKPSRKATS